MKILWLSILAAALSAECVGSEMTAPQPTVTAKGWAIADGKTGKLLWGFQEDQPRKSASTTKMMNAGVILLLAEKDPKVLDETVTFSQSAGTTAGSTAGIKPGESVSVRECLYGLLLPSGNDAGNALSEHFNARFAAPDAAMLTAGLNRTSLVTRVHFVAEMNRTARRFGMTNTFYRSAFGDGGFTSDLTSTPRDLTQLAWRLMQKAVFRQYVGTKRYEGRVQCADGSTRTAVWENTNELLGTEGFDGVKTGQTTSAGGCLVASCRRGDRHLISAVLGCGNGKARFTDTQALLEWAWQRCEGAAATNAAPASKSP